MGRKMKIANLQLNVFDKKEDNMKQLERVLRDGIHENADLVMLGEMFNCPYRASDFPVYAEKEGGESWKICAELASKYRIYLEAGSMPEVDEQGRVYNTAYVFDRNGKQIAKHRKAHLFDIDVVGGQSFKESDTLSAGDKITVFDTEFCRMGLCICFDFRFPEQARVMTLNGAEVILVPAAFNMTTGPAHWETMFRQRAVDNQIYTVGNAPARDMKGVYTSWGHSIIVDPWGNIVMQMDEKAQVKVTEIDLGEVGRVRKELPLLAARRTDLYGI